MLECKVLKNKIYVITQWYYNTKKYKHEAVDITGLKNNKHVLDYVVAHSSGKVIQVINNCNVNTSGEKKYGSKKKDPNNPGNVVLIDHGNGYKTRYLHLAYGTIKVKNGENVSAGQIIGYMGNTGYSFGGHLHFEVIKDGKKINPIEYLNLSFNSKEQVKNDKNKNEDIDKNIEYIVKKGDTLSIIAKKYNTTYQKLAEFNNITNPNIIHTGQKIIIPKNPNAGSIIYVVKKGDSLSSIAAKYKTTWNKIYNDNKNTIGNNPNLIYPNQKLIIKQKVI